MLLLTRKVGESIIIDGGITITVTDIKGGQVRIGIDAPKEVKVYREEIINKLQAEKNQHKSSGADMRYKLTIT